MSFGPLAQKGGSFYFSYEKPVVVRITIGTMLLKKKILVN